jgi:hypothetical protein
MKQEEVKEFERRHPHHPWGFIPWPKYSAEIQIGWNFTPMSTIRPYIMVWA